MIRLGRPTGWGPAHDHAAGEQRPTIAAFTGLPGTGKSTLAELTGRALEAPVFSGDWLLGSMKPAHKQLAELDRATSLELYVSVLTGLLTRQLMLDQSGVADCLVTDATAAQWAHLAAAHGAQLKLVECVCSDETVHRSRVDGRVRGIPGWHEIDWHHVERMRSEFAPLTVDRLVVDAVQPLEANLQRILDYVCGR